MFNYKKIILFFIIAVVLNVAIFPLINGAVISENQNSFGTRNTINITELIINYGNDDLLWSENFDDGDISDWNVDNPNAEWDPIRLEVTSEDYHSSPYSLVLDSPHEAGYAGYITGPDVILNKDEIYSVEFWFKYNSFHFCRFFYFYNIGLIIDYPHLPMKYTSGSEEISWSEIGSFDDYCPRNTWTHFKFIVEPATNSLTMHVNDINLGTVNYGGYESKKTGVFFGELGQDPDFFDHAYFDDFKIYGEGGGAGIFYDNFNDRVRDVEKWTEIYTNGSWVEDNKMAEFSLYQSGGTVRKEGIESIPFNVSISENEALKINWDMNSNISSSCGQGVLCFEIKNNNDWIRAKYDREKEKLTCIDSTDLVETTLYDYRNDFERDDGEWDNELILYKNQYYLRMSYFDVPWIEHQVFSDNTKTLQIKMFIEIGGSDESKHLNAGFDDIKVIGKYEGNNTPPVPPYIRLETEKGRIRESYNYYLSTNDPDGDEIYYFIDWGDGQTEDTFFIPSGNELIVEHTYYEPDIYNIRAKAIDSKNAESEWSTVKVTMPKSTYFHILEDLFHNRFSISRFLRF